MQCKEPGCSKPVDRDGYCFRCRIKDVGVTFRGGAIVGRKGWNTTTRDYHEEHFGVSSGKELAKTRPDVGRYDD